MISKKQMRCIKYFVNRSHLMTQTLQYSSIDSSSNKHGQTCSSVTIISGVNLLPNPLDKEKIFMRFSSLEWSREDEKELPDDREHHIRINWLWFKE